MNRLDGLTVHDLRVVATLAEALHFGRAATILGVSQPTVSAALSKFESVVGFEVFFRTSRRCELTPRGSIAVGHVRAVLSELEPLDPALEPDVLRGVLRLGLIPTVAPYFLPAIMRRVQEAYPNLSIYFTEGHTERVLDGVGTHQLDAAIVSSYERKRNIEGILLFREPLLVHLPCGHSLAKLSEIPQDALKADELLLLDQGNCLRDQALKLCDSEASGDHRAHSTSMPTLFYLVASKAGYAIIPHMARTAAAQVPETVVRPLAGTRTRDVILAFRSGDRREAHFKALAQVLRSTSA